MSSTGSRKKKMRKTMQTFHELLTEGTQLLVSAGIEEARLDAWLLLEYTADIGHAWYYAHPETEAGEKTALKYLELCKQRAEHPASASDTSGVLYGI